MSQALTLQPCTLVCFLALTHVRQGTWEDGAKKEECKRRFNRRNHTSICYSSAEAVRKHLHVCKCFLWNSIMFLLVDSNPQCHRGNLCAIVDLCFTRPGGNHVFDPVHTSVYYSICHYWNMCSASQLRTSVFSLRFANGVFLKGSVKQAGKIMSRQKIDAQLFCWKCVFHFLLFCLVVWAHLSDYPDVYHLCHLLSHLCFIVSHLPMCPYIALLPCRHLPSQCLLLVAVF